jgi:hypothetical protein
MSLTVWGRAHPDEAIRRVGTILGSMSSASWESHTASDCLVEGQPSDLLSMPTAGRCPSIRHVNEPGRPAALLQPPQPVTTHAPNCRPSRDACPNKRPIGVCRSGRGRVVIGLWPVVSAPVDFAAGAGAFACVRGAESHWTASRRGATVKAAGSPPDGAARKKTGEGATLECWQKTADLLTVLPKHEAAVKTQGREMGP